MASSLAFWIDYHNKDEPEKVVSTSSPKTQPKGVELHFNYWLLDTGRTGFVRSVNKRNNVGTIEYLDIGVKLLDKISFKAINFYLPFHIDEDDYNASLGETICKDIEVISTVFNRSVGKVEPQEKLGCYDIDLVQQGEQTNTMRFFTHLTLAPSHDGVTIKKSDDLLGTEIVFPGGLFNMDQLMEGQTGYFRFRIVLTAKNRGVISKINRAKDSWLTNHFDKSELVDFRLNEARILPTAIRRKVARRQFIKKIHFFLIRDASAEYKAAHSDYKCRLLEEELWSKYLGNDEACNRNNMLIYHWSDKAEDNSYLDNFSAFARFVRRTVSNWQLFAFVLSVLVTGVLSGVGANYVWRYFDEGVQSPPCKLDLVDKSYFDLNYSLELDSKSILTIMENPYIGSHSSGGELHE